MEMENEEHATLHALIEDECCSVTEINREALGFADLILSRLSNDEASLKKCLSISTNCPENEDMENFSSLARGRGIDFCFWQINDCYIEIEPTDLLIINSLKTYHHLYSTLTVFAKDVKKYICIPNMCKQGVPCETEESYEGNYLEYLDPIRQKKCDGVWRAIEDFLKENSDWGIRKDDSMLILFRINDFIPLKNFQLHPEVDFYLKNKIRDVQLFL